MARNNPIFFSTHVYSTLVKSVPVTTTLLPNNCISLLAKSLSLCLFLLLGACSTTGSFAPYEPGAEVIETTSRPDDIEVIRYSDRNSLPEQDQNAESEPFDSIEAIDELPDRYIEDHDSDQAILEDGPLRSVEAQLLADAAGHFRSGSIQLASASVERALRINPHSAMALVELAKLRLAQESPKEAEQLLLKAVGAGAYDRRANQPTFQREAWALIVQARQALGDRQGTVAAQARLNDLMSNQ